MQHDEKYLSGGVDHGGEYISEDDCHLHARQYHEHMMRWRPIKELPEWGDWIEVLCNDLGDVHTITYGPGRFKDADRGWRPAMPIKTKET